MAPVSYYYILSLLFAGVPLLWLVNILFIKLKGVTAFGRITREGTPGHRRLLKLASRKNIFITAAISCLLLANFIMSILAVLSLDGTGKYGLIVGASIIVILLYALGILKLRKVYKEFHPDDKDQKKNIRKYINRGES